MAKKADRFIKTYVQSGGFTGPRMEILVDRQTGVNYVFAQSGYSGGLTVLLDRDGKPVITPISKQYEE